MGNQICLDQHELEFSAIRRYQIEKFTCTISEENENKLHSSVMTLMSTLVFISQLPIIHGIFLCAFSNYPCNLKCMHK